MPNGFQHAQRNPFKETTETDSSIHMPSLFGRSYQINNKYLHNQLIKHSLRVLTCDILEKLAERNFDEKSMKLTPSI